MQTCECCGREHNGRGSWCAHCNSHDRSTIAAQPGRRQRSANQASAMDYTEDRERNADEGWPYEDGAEDEYDRDRKTKF